MYSRNKFSHQKLKPGVYLIRISWHYGFQERSQFHHNRLYPRTAILVSSSDEDDVLTQPHLEFQELSRTYLRSTNLTCISTDQTPADHTIPCWRFMRFLHSQYSIPLSKRWRPKSTWHMMNLLHGKGFYLYSM